MEAQGALLLHYWVKIDGVKGSWLIFHILERESRNG